MAKSDTGRLDQAGPLAQPHYFRQLQ